MNTRLASSLGSAEFPVHRLQVKDGTSPKCRLADGCTVITSNLFRKCKKTFENWIGQLADGCTVIIPRDVETIIHMSYVETIIVTDHTRRCCNNTQKRTASKKGHKGYVHQ